MQTDIRPKTNLAGLERNNAEIKRKLDQSAEERLNTQKRAFFQLLATQLQHQDPTNPMDTNQMTAQIFAMNSLEQQIESNKYLNKIHAVLQEQQSVQPASSIGSIALYEGDVIELENGKAEFKYVIPDNAERANLTIRDSNNSRVFTAPLEKDAGEHTFKWDGKDAAGGVLPDGEYKVAIDVYGKNNVVLKPRSLVTGRIDGVIAGDGGYKYSIGGRPVEPSKIKEYRGNLDAIKAI